jgi:hypothetical protein
VRLHVARELDEVVESRIEQLKNARDVDAEIPVDQDVAKAGDAPEAPRKRRGQDREVAQDVDGGGVIRGIAAGARRQGVAISRAFWVQSCSPRSTAQRSSGSARSAARGRPAWRRRCWTASSRARRCRLTTAGSSWPGLIGRSARARCGPGGRPRSWPAGGRSRSSARAHGPPGWWWRADRAQGSGCPRGARDGTARAGLR